MEVIRIQLWQPRIQSWQLTIISFEATSFLGGVKIDHQRSPGRNLMPFELLEASWKVLGSVLDCSRSPGGRTNVLLNGSCPSKTDPKTISSDRRGQEVSNTEAR